nr:ABC transporter substrate-binding protein [Anaerolineae bacterium]
KPAAPAATVATVATPKPPAPKISQNLTDGCATVYDENTDYFPEKIQISHAINLKVDYFKNYKLVTISNPWRGAKEQFSYALVQCGTPAPKNLPANTSIVEVPVKRIITTSTTEVASLDRIGAIDKIVALDDFTYVSNAKVREMIKAGKLKEVGGGSKINLEQVLTLKPDIVFAAGLGNPEYDTHPKLIEAKVNVGIDASYMEQLPLGRAEWSKYLALFLNREAQATTAFNEVQDKYNAVANKMKAAGKKPTSFNSIPFKDTWSISGGQSYAARFVSDAGGQHLWADDTSTGSIPLKFEQVLDKAAKADFWLLNAFDKPADMKALFKIDPRFSNFAATTTGNVWNFDKRVNENGGNDYYETGSANPHLILADIAKIFHPDLMKDHEFVFYRQLAK